MAMEPAIHAKHEKNSLKIPACFDCCTLTCTGIDNCFAASSRKQKINNSNRSKDGYTTEICDRHKPDFEREVKAFSVCVCVCVDGPA